MQAFREQKYPEAVKFYSEALKRGPPSVNPDAHKLYSNRAACFTKLGAYPDGIKDADECITLKPDFPKGYSRKGLLQFFMKDYDKAIATYQVPLGMGKSNSLLAYLFGLSSYLVSVKAYQNSVAVVLFATACPSLPKEPDDAV